MKRKSDLRLVNGNPKMFCKNCGVEFAEIVKGKFKKTIHANIIEIEDNKRELRREAVIRCDKCEYEDKYIIPYTALIYYL